MFDKVQVLMQQFNQHDENCEFFVKSPGNSTTRGFLVILHNVNIQNSAQSLDHLV